MHHQTVNINIHIYIHIISCTIEVYPPISLSTTSFPVQAHVQSILSAHKFWAMQCFSPDRLNKSQRCQGILSCDSFSSNK